MTWDEKWWLSSYTRVILLLYMICRNIFVFTLYNLLIYLMLAFGWVVTNLFYKGRFLNASLENDVQKLWLIIFTPSNWEHVISKYVWLTILSQVSFNCHTWSMLMKKWYRIGQLQKRKLMLRWDHIGWKEKKNGEYK